MPLSKKAKMLIGVDILLALGGAAYLIYWKLEDDKKKPAQPAAPAVPAVPAGPAAPAAATAARRAGFIRKRETLSANSENSILARSDMPGNPMSNLVSSSGVLANASIRSIVGDRSIPRSV